MAWLVSPIEAAVPAPEIVEQARGFRLASPRLEIEVRDGVIVAATNRLTGEVHASAAGDAASAAPAGMGLLGDSPERAVSLHNPWGRHGLAPPGNRARAYPNLHRPDSQSDFRAVRTAEGIEATWRDLTNGQARFPDEQITIIAGVDRETGGLWLRCTATSPDGGGVYGVQVPLANLHAGHRLYVPSFGGMMYDRRMPPRLYTLGDGAPFWEAPVIGLEGDRGSLGLWVEDDAFRPHFGFLTWTGESFAAAIESLNGMPFEPHQGIRSVTWRLDAFDGGWTAAMTPYRQWYARTFADELARRGQVGWADSIQVVLDQMGTDPAVWEKVAALVDPKTVLVHEWNARAPGFDQELPDWTPRPGYPERVRALQALGYRTMAYVNTYCVNYNSPVFVRDGIADFGLPRTIRGFSRYLGPRQSFATARDGELLYLDPLAPGWRTYHTDQMIRWRNETGTDANYEDTGGTGGDFGNGTIDGLAGAQGAVEQFRDLLQRNSEVPMAAEYGPDSIAFAVRWPLRFQQVWGSDTNRAEWMVHQRPVSAFLFGPNQRAWVPTLRAETEFLEHVVVACSDALGGLAQFHPRLLDARAGIAAQMRERALLFSRRQLVPDFSPALADPTLACRYRDREGRTYAYHADETLQRLVDDEGQELYARLTGVNRFATPLNMAGWPARDDRELIGLNPAVRYALMPTPESPTAVKVRALPEGVFVRRFYELPVASVLVLETVNDQGPDEGTCEFALEGVREVVIDGQSQPVPPPGRSLTLETRFPAALVFVRGEPDEGQIGEYLGDDQETGRYILASTGIERGGRHEVPHRARMSVPGEAEPVPLFLLVGGTDSEVTMDWLVRVPNSKAALRIYLQPRPSPHGDGVVAKVYLNGVLRHAEEIGPTPAPEPGAEPNRPGFLAWTLPVDQYAGQPLLVSVASDPKTSNNADNLWWSRPKLIAQDEPEESYSTLDDPAAVPAAAGDRGR